MMRSSGALAARNSFGSSWSKSLRAAERVDPTMAREALVANVIYEQPFPTTPRGVGRKPPEKIALGILLEVREPAGKFLLIAGRMRVSLSDAEWGLIDSHCKDEIGDGRSPARMAMRWFVSDDMVLDGRPDQFSLLRIAMAEPTFALRVDPPAPLPIEVRHKLASAKSQGEFVGVAEEAALASYLAVTAERSVGFFAVFPNLS